MVLLNRPFFHLSIADNGIAFGCLFVIYPHLLLSPSHFQNSLSTFSKRELMRNLFGISTENNNHSRIFYRNDNIVRLQLQYSNMLALLRQYKYESVGVLTVDYSRSTVQYSSTIAVHY